MIAIKMIGRHSLYVRLGTGGILGTIEQNCRLP